MSRFRNARPRLALALACLAAAGAACRESGKPPAASAPSSLATVINAMPVAAQIDTLRGLRALHPDDAQIAFLTGNAYHSLGAGLEASAPSRAAYFDSSTAAYHRAVELDSTLSKAWVNMGLSYQEAGKPADARQALETAIKVNPKDVLAYCHLGFLKQTTGHVSEAVRHYQTAISIDPNSAQAHYNLGLAFAEAKIFQEALREWETVIRLDPNGDLGKTATENVRIIRQYTGTTP